MQFLRNLKKDIQLTRKGYYTRLLKRHFGPFKKRQAWLSETQYYNKEQLEKLQLDAFQYLVCHAYETVPYYRDYMKQKGFGPDDIVSLDDLQRFEVINKDVVREQADRFVSTKYMDRFMRTVHTGGTTGTPLPIRRNLRSIQTEHAFLRRQFDWAGVKMSDRVAYLTWRRMAAPNETARLYAYDAGLKELHLSTVHLSEETIIPYAETIKKYNVKAINGYPSAVYFMAKGLLAKNYKIKLNAILTTSETMEPHQREVIEKAFQCSVFDYYGCAERVCYIHTCEKGQYHILPEYGITELIPAEAPNEGCYRVIGTGFWNMAMPLIRYDMGDLVTKQEGTCSCGREFPMVSRIMGRDGSYIQTPSGRVLGAMAIEYIMARVLYSMYEMPILEGQIIQDGDNMIVLEYVALDTFTDDNEQDILNLLREEIPSEMEVSVRKIDKMNQTERGKYLSFVRNEHH